MRNTTRWALAAAALLAAATACSDGDDDVPAACGPLHEEAERLLAVPDDAQDDTYLDELNALDDRLRDAGCYGDEPFQPVDDTIG